MARIRSVHPGLFTDEAFVQLSADAQIFFVGLLTECDDQGAFEWKPITLKIKLRGGKDGPVEPLLAELEAVNIIRSYEHDGRKLGAVRNFCRYQRPKKPQAIHFIPDEFRTYVGLTKGRGEPDHDDDPSVPNRFGTGGEKSPQMEEGGGRMKDEGGKMEGEKEDKTAVGGSGPYAFVGRVVKLNQEDLAKWEQAYSAIPDLRAELTTLDAYYDAELQGKERRNWFIRCSAALGKKHQEWAARRAAETAQAQAQRYGQAML